MRVIGILGGMSWQSTQLYYDQINTLVGARLGGLHSAELLIYSVDFGVIEKLQHDGDWEGAARILADAGAKLARGGAEAILIATNTMHKMADEIAAASGLPILHIADATAQAITNAGYKKPLLLATAFTMEQDFYKGRLIDPFKLAPIIPNAADRAEIHRIIYDELCLGIISPKSKSIYQDIIARYEDNADCVILGCTEITMLIGQDDVNLPVFDTTALHGEAAVNFALGSMDRDSTSYG